MLRLRRRLPPDGETAAAPRFACCRLGQGPWRRSGCGTTSCSPKAWARTSKAPRRSRRQHARSALARPAASARPPRQADHEPDRRSASAATSCRSAVPISTRTSSTRWPTRSLADIMAAAHRRHEPGLCRRRPPDGRSAPAAARRSLAGAVLSDDDAGHGRRRPADRHQSLRPTGRRSLQEAHERKLAAGNQQTGTRAHGNYACAGWDTTAG